VIATHNAVHYLTCRDGARLQTWWRRRALHLQLAVILVAVLAEGAELGRARHAPGQVVVRDGEPCQPPQTGELWWCPPSEVVVGQVQTLQSYMTVGSLSRNAILKGTRRDTGTNVHRAYSAPTNPSYPIRS
jgi:hypothetical protein